MPAEQAPDVAMGDNGGRRPSLSAIVTRRAATEMHGEENLTAVAPLNETHVSSLIELQARELENSDRQSEREYGERKDVETLELYPDSSAGHSRYHCGARHHRLSGHLWRKRVVRVYPVRHWRYNCRRIWRLRLRQSHALTPLSSAKLPPTNLNYARIASTHSEAPPCLSAILLNSPGRMKTPA